MNLSPGAVVAVGGAYVALLFVIAFATDRLAAAGRAKFLVSPVVYTLSLAVYCTTWTFFGAVGSAARSGLEFVTIYIGPTLALMAWWLFLPKLVRVAKAQKITSIADFLSARYGKSRAVAVLVTVIAIAAITPYIALQLIAVGRSFEALAGEGGEANTSFWVAASMAFFVIIFGTRRLNADESQPGIVAAIAFESIVKLAALLAVAVYAVMLLRGGVSASGALADTNAATASVGDWRAATANVGDWRAAMGRVGALDDGEGARWVVLTTLSAAAIVCLPRQFQVMVVENRDERHIAVASWLFPLYLFLLTLAVLPIAAAGLTLLPASTEPDLYVLTLPLMHGSTALALAAFVGGLSAATSMVIVASLVLAVMISNHLVAPMLARHPRRSPRGLASEVLATRRIAIVGVLALGFVYARVQGASGGLASIGLISFAGVAQFAPALVGGLFWRRANRFGATAGLALGAAAWLTLLLLPSFGAGLGILAAARSWLLPEALGATDPLVFGTTVSIGLNVVAYVIVSLVSRGGAIDQLQATLFVDALRRGGIEPTLRRSANRRDLLRLTQRILGPDRAHKLFADGARDADADAAFVARIERELGYAVGAASAHDLVTRVATGEPLDVDAAITLMRDTQRAIEAARALGVRSVELERNAADLATANEGLTELLLEKDDFLSRVSHEMRTPLTAIRAFAELLRSGEPDPARAARFVDIIGAESERLTRLLDDILDLAKLEAGIAPVQTRRIDVRDVVRDAAAALEGFALQRGVAIAVDARVSLPIVADADRLQQVLVNLLSNAVKFHGTRREITVEAAAEDGRAVVRVIDHGPGVSEAVRARLFTKFAGTAGPGGRSGAGLGLAISRQITTRLGGDLVLEATGPDGSTFRLSLPLDR